MTMNGSKSVRWMVTFWHRDGDWRDESDFPEISFWHPSKYASRTEAARVLIELREERGDERDWTAAGYPDPYQIDPVALPGQRWALRYEDLDFDDDKLGTDESGKSEDGTHKKRRALGLKTGAGGWIASMSDEEFENLKKMLHESRHAVPRSSVEL